VNDEGGIKNLRNNEELLMKIVSMTTDVRNMSLAFNQNPFSQFKKGSINHDLGSE
jgi:hypothetical protein